MEEEDEVVEMTSCGETEREEMTITKAKGDGHGFIQLAGGTKRGGYHVNVTKPHANLGSESNDNEGEGTMDLCNYEDGVVGRSYQVGGGEFSSHGGMGNETHTIAQSNEYSRNIEAMSTNALRILKNTSTSAFESNVGVGERACRVSTFYHCFLAFEPQNPLNRF